MAFKTLTLEVRDNIAHLTMNRPESMNTLDPVMARELRDVSIRLKRDAAVRAVLFSGAGRIFSGGGDLSDFHAAGDDAANLIEAMTIDFHAAINRFNKMDAPFIAAVHGAAGGAGMSMVSAADLVVAGESTKFTMSYTRVGLVPDGSSSFFLARNVGLKRAMDLVLTNRVLSAQEAADWGLVSRIVPDEDVAAEGLKLATELAAGPTKTFGLAKQVIYEGLTSSLEEAMERESFAISTAVATEDGKEGMDAFLNKRAVEFKGK